MLGSRFWSEFFQHRFRMSTVRHAGSDGWTVANVTSIGDTMTVELIEVARRVSIQVPLGEEVEAHGIELPHRACELPPQRSATAAEPERPTRLPNGWSSGGRPITEAMRTCDHPRPVNIGRSAVLHCGKCKAQKLP